MRDGCSQLVRDATLDERYRAHLLRLLAGRTTDVRTFEAPLVKLARELASLKSHVGRAAVAVMLARAPSAGLTHSSDALIKEQAADLFQDLLERGLVLTVPWQDWPADHRLVLARTLHRLELREERPAGFHAVDDDEKLVELRNRVLSSLATDPDVDLGALIAIRPDYEQRLRARREGQAFEQELAAIQPERGAVVEPRRTVEVLDTPPVFEPRSVEDLFRTITWLLEEKVDPSVARELLWEGSTKRDGWKHERALQAYVMQRVGDLLDGVRGAAISREPTEAYGDEPDFVVTLGKEQLPIEVKWSHNKDVVGALTSQLVRRYLLDRRRTHGIYLVGFSGAGSRSDIDALRDELRASREAACEMHPELRIGVVVLSVDRAG